MISAEMFDSDQQLVDASEHVFGRIERSNWAPWLQADSARIAERMRVFPAGHLILLNGDAETPIGFLSTNRISWDGDSDSLRTWDDIAGVEGNFRETFEPDGNTVCLMSMGVAAAFKGQHIAEQLVREIQKYARDQDVSHIIGDFRPSGFGGYKHSESDYNFAEYVRRTREDGNYLDPWLRNVSLLGMMALKVDNRAMVIPGVLDDLVLDMVEYKPEAWYEIEDKNEVDQLTGQHHPELDLEHVNKVIECEETGTWYVDTQNKRTVYIESNYWGEIPLEP